LKSSFDRRNGKGPLTSSPQGRKMAREQSQISAIAEVNRLAEIRRLKTEKLKAIRLARAAEEASAPPRAKPKSPSKAQ
jgi:hypothetical protein